VLGRVPLGGFDLGDPGQVAGQVTGVLAGDAGDRLARPLRAGAGISVRMPKVPETAALKLPEGTPVAELIRTVHDTKGNPVEVMIAVIAGDMVSFDYDFPVPD